MLDIPAHRTLKTIPVGGTPHFIIIGLYPPPGNITPLQTPSTNIIPIALLFALAITALVVVVWTIWKQHKKSNVTAD